MPFYEALSLLLKGIKIRRTKWGKTAFIYMQVPKANERVIKLDTEQTWMVTSDDILASDWEIKS